MHKRQPNLGKRSVQVARLSWGAAMNINVLILVDASTSLLSTDPTELRVEGVIRATSSLEDIADRYAEAVNMQVAVDGFSTEYYQYLGWVSPSEINAALETPAIRDNVARTIRWTNYVDALKGASQRFAETTAADCNLLVWFTEWDTRHSRSRCPCRRRDQSTGPPMQR